MAACVNSLLGLTEENDDEPEGHGSNHHSDEGFMGGMWSTFVAGTAIPFGPGFAFQAEVGAVVGSFGITDTAWIGGPPVILNLGLVYSF